MSATSDFESVRTRCIFLLLRLGLVVEPCLPPEYISDSPMPRSFLESELFRMLPCLESCRFYMLLVMLRCAESSRSARLFELRSGFDVDSWWREEVPSRSVNSPWKAAE